MSEADVLIDLHKELSNLSTSGKNAQLRRCLDIIADKANECSGEKVIASQGELQSEDFPNFFPETLAGKQIEDPIGFGSTIREARADDRRRSVMLDPFEHAVQQFIDFFSGRLDSLEFRVGREGFNNDLLNSAKTAAIDYIRHNEPTVSAMVVSPLDVRRSIDSLRCLAAYLESGLEEENISFLRNRHEVETLRCPGHFRHEKCKLQKTETFGQPQWSKDGKRLIQEMREIYWCEGCDGYCTNEIEEYESTKYRPKTIWVDDGKLSNPPPILPPDFDAKPWDNRCPFFESGLTFNLTSDWGWRRLQGRPTPDFHEGIDLGAPAQTKIFAVHEGIVTAIERNAPRGNTYVLLRSGNEAFKYLHIDPEDSLAVGDLVDPGVLLGTVSPHTVNSKGEPAIHLHYSRHRNPASYDDQKMLVDENSVNPCP